MNHIGETIKVLSANVQGLADKNKREDVLNFFKNKNPDILCLVDTHLTNKHLSDIKRIWDGEVLLNGTRTNARGISIFFSKQFEYTFKDVKNDNDCNLSELNKLTNNLNIKLIVIYAPNCDYPEFFSDLKNRINQNEEDYIIICGDFNLVIDPKIDSNNYVNINNPQSRNILLDMLNSSNLIDLD